MPRRPRPVTYAEAMAALHDAYQTLHDLCATVTAREVMNQMGAKEWLIEDERRDAA